MFWHGKYEKGVIGPCPPFPHKYKKLFGANFNPYQPRARFFKIVPN
jgi:hypothetical protein